MSTALAILAAAIGAFAALSMLGLLLAGMPNSSPAQVAYIRRLMLLTLAVGAAGIIGGVRALAAGKPWVSCALGGAPAAHSLVLFIILLNTGP